MKQSELRQIIREEVKNALNEAAGIRLGVSEMDMIQKSLITTNIDSSLAQEMKSYIDLMHKDEYVSTEKEKAMEKLLYSKKEGILNSLKDTMKTRKTPYASNLVSNLANRFQDLVDGKLDFIHID